MLLELAPMNFFWLNKNRRELWSGGALAIAIEIVLILILRHLLQKGVEYETVWFARELLAFIQAMLQALDVALH